MKIIASLRCFYSRNLRILIVLSALLPAVLFAQDYQESALEKFYYGSDGHEADRWYFGYHAGLDFRDAEPAVDLSNDSLDIYTSSAVMADSYGDILFFTNGRRVYDRNRELMPDGNGLHGYYAATMPVIIIPHPSDSLKYFIFTVDLPQITPWDTNHFGLQYSEVDMSLNSGLGNVTEIKNIPLVPEVSSKITAARHSNGNDYWVVVHRWDSDEFISFPVTAEGVDTVNMVSSHAGSMHPGPVEDNNYVGQMKISPDGTKLALAIYGENTYEIFDFNTETGSVSNAITSPDTYEGAYGIEFSSDAHFLYTTTISVGAEPGFISRLYQFDLSTGGSVFSTEVEMASNDVLRYYAGLQLATDGRIYIARSPMGNWGVSRIENPKREGTECNLVEDAIGLEGRYSRYGFPNFIQSYFHLPHFNAMGNISNSPTYFTLQNISNIESVMWNFGDPLSSQNTSNEFNPSHVYSAAGTYQVSLTEIFNGMTYGPYVESVTIHDPSSIKEPDAGETFFGIYPNPGCGDLTLGFLKTSKKVEVCIYNLTGEKVLGPCNYGNVHQGDQIFLKMHDLPDGLYLVRVECDGRMSTNKYFLRK